MKKIVSLAALCAVLFGAVLMVTGCGQPAGQSVWKVTKGGMVADGVTTYMCFHTDGNLYLGFKGGGNLYSRKLGTYKHDAANKKITIKFEEGGETSNSYTIKGQKMTFDLLGFGSLELEKSRDFTEKQIKDAPKLGR